MHRVSKKKGASNVLNLSRTSNNLVLRTSINRLPISKKSWNRFSFREVTKSSIPLSVKTCSLVNEKTIEDGTLDLLLNNPNISMNRDAKAINMDRVKFLDIWQQRRILILTLSSSLHVPNLVIVSFVILWISKQLYFLHEVSKKGSAHEMKFFCSTQIWFPRSFHESPGNPFDPFDTQFL